jgi:hypothetical protein
MNEDFEQFLATIIEQCLAEHHMQPPLVVRTTGDNGSVLVAGINEGAELVVLTKHRENDTFTLPMNSRSPAKITGPCASSSSGTATSACFTDHRS